VVLGQCLLGRLRFGSIYACASRRRFAGGAAFTIDKLLEPLSDTLAGVCCGSEVEEALVGGDVLEDGFEFAVDGEDDGALGGFELLHRVVAEGGEG
jgi:hypothetical protein